MPSPIRRALLSVSDKTGLVEFASGLAKIGVALVSTGGTARALRDAGLECTDVSAMTGFPEMMDGRVKTLHPAVHGGLLARRDHADDVASLESHGIAPIDLVAINLYPFEEALARNAGLAELVEQIDVGGPAMLRAAAKNHAHVTAICDPADYGPVLAEMAELGGETRPATRLRLAAKVFARTAAYDSAVSGRLLEEAGEKAPRWRAFGGMLQQTLRYGENPHQWAALYRSGEARPGVAAARQVQGKELSYNNIADADAAFECVAEFPGDERAACVIVKHANPCGAALGSDPVAAYRAALACDPVSAFGGIVALNRPLDEATASEIGKLFAEVIIVPGTDEGAMRVLARKENLRLLITDGLPDPLSPGLAVRSIAGGLLVQSRDAGRVDPSALKVVTQRAPTERELSDLLFAARICKHVKSNAIVLARNGATVGIGAGQMSRVDASRIAAVKAEDAAKAAGQAESLARGSVVASDAFFPFPDALVEAHRAGATAAIQPGGSMRDKDVIAAADSLGMAMVLTGLRHFRH